MQKIQQCHTWYKSGCWRKLFRVMRIIVFLLLSNLLVANATNSFSQKSKVTFRATNSTIVEVLDELMEKADVSILYSIDELDNSKSVTVNFKDASLKDVLNSVLGGQKVGYSILNDKVIISRKKYKSEVKQDNESKPLKGKIVDKDGNGVPGINVVVKGTTIGVVTDLDGNYNIKVPTDAQIIVFSFIGMKTQEVIYKGQEKIDVTMLEDAQGLDEVVVTAFGTAQKKESVVGSIQSIRPDDLVVPSTNLTNAFAGRLSGVIAYQRSGEPGADGSSFYIRGISTLSGAKDPLIVIDGVESSSASLNSMPPEVIESFSILKDATATAMYGTRGANGVLIVTTKSGADMAKPAINIRMENTINTPTSVPDFVSGPKYMRMYNEAVSNQSLGDRLYTAEEIAGTEQGLDPYVFPNVDWYDELFKSFAMSQNVNFNVRGGGKKLDYFMNVAYKHQDGLLKKRSDDFFSFKNNIKVSKYVFQNNINLRLSDISKISLKLNTQLQSKTSPSESTSSLYSDVINTSPVLFPVMFPDEDGDYDWIKWGGTTEGNAISNPLAELTKGYKESFQSNITANLEFDQKLDFLLEGLKFKGLVSFRNKTYSETKRTQGYNKYQITDYSKEGDGYVYELEPVGDEDDPVLSTSGSVSGDRRIYFQTYLDYTRKFGLHDVNAMLLYNQDQYNNNKVSSLMSSLPKRKQGLAARVSYGYDNKYMFEVNLGYNGSENFAKNHRWGFFPSVAAGYNVSREEFFKPLSNVVTNLKIRASYGLVGNDNIGGERFVYLSDIDLTGSGKYRTGYGSTTRELAGPKYKRYRNDKITWEVGKKLNIGVDLQLFRDLNIVLDVFRENREDIFQERGTIPNYLGTSETKVFGNYAAVRNQGFDLAIDYGKVLNEDWTIQFKGTFTFAKNEITKYDEAPYMEYPQLRKVGSSLNRLTGYKSDNLFIDWNHINVSAEQQISGNVAPGDIKYIDQPNAEGEKDGIINANDKVAMGYPTVPQIVYGFGPSVKYKKLDFSCLFQGVARTSLMMSGFHPFGTQNSRNVLDFIAKDYWSPNNQNIYAKYPRLTKISHSNNTTASDFWLRDASFLKLKNVELGYNFKKMRLYLSGMNLLTFSSFDHWDPEQGGGSGLKYPTQRSYNIGLQISL
ncbi:SusC/RagA family TonB-linked outer membrane protein [Puteibacter caeruleilacunae]|nr:SusC/RagA family TonB-linked outer membrane protein [Puteibacter caeruleilacunae]